MDQYQAVAKPEVKSCEIVLFWSHEWEIGSSRIPLRQRFARLFSFARDDKLS
jgi:hypothetical protein